MLIGSDLTYNRDAWPVLFETIRAARAPCLLSASERRPNELASLKDAMSKAGLSYRVRYFTPLVSEPPHPTIAPLAIYHSICK